MNRVKLAKGKLPEKKEEIVVSENFLETMGISGEIGDKITLPFQAEQEGKLCFPKNRNSYLRDLALTQRR